VERKMGGKAEKWIEAHRDYPHKEWCLIWPFSRDPGTGRGMMQGGWAHRYMCEAVNGPAPPDKPQAAHSCGNGDQACVNPWHLDWADNSENQLDRTRHGRAANGIQHYFTPEQIAKMKEQYGEFTQTKLAEMYGCSLGTIQYYLRYREERGHAGGKVNRWHPSEIEKLRGGIAQGMNFTQLAEHVGRPRSAVEMKTYRLGLKSGVPPIPRSFNPDSSVQ
jgi:hypothetical protein